MNWKDEIKYSLRTASDLYREGLISEADIAPYDTLFEKYSFLLPRYYADLIDKSNLNCPIRLQAVPSLQELKDLQPMKKDPFEDLKHKPAPRITHRYSNRVLFHLTSNCSMYCRFCFRKTLLNELSTQLFEGDFEQSLDYIRKNTAIEEVIFSGGDPFLANEGLLAKILLSLNEMNHVERVRFHTRVPVTLPLRVDRDFIQILSLSKKPLVVVSHFNHPKELTVQAFESLQSLGKISTLFNQAVLLKGINDLAEIQMELAKKLFEFKVQPYYLHHPDSSAGTSHFHISLERGLEIYSQMQKNLPGYLLPKYVVDTGDSLYKKSAEVVALSLR